MKRFTVWEISISYRFYFGKQNNVKLIRENLAPLFYKFVFLQKPPVIEMTNSSNTLELGGMFGQVWHIIGEQLNYR